MITRRDFLKGALAGLAGAGVLSSQALRAAAPTSAVRIRIGSCRLNLPQARLAGLDGVELVVSEVGDKLRLADPAVRQQYKAQQAETGVAICSLMLSLLNSNPLATDPRAPAWLEQAIDAAKDLGADVILAPFFGQADLLKEGQLQRAEVEIVIERLKAAAPRAKDAGIVLALENRLSAKQNEELLQRLGHPSVRVYYDVGNSTSLGYDVPAEIRALKDRLACIHFKDRNHYLGEGQIQFPAIAEAIQQVGYRGWIVLETANPSGDAVADAKRNGAYVRKLFGGLSALR
jgi:sugar phosphate isomerase/epimerase